jgi:NADH:ubiquinone oxidoreductase subunit F (NADH-binding)
VSLPRLLAGAHADRPLSLAEHVALHGPSPRGGSQLIERVEHAGLRGRGGASFTAAVKLRSVAEQRGPRTLLVNAAEGDPMSAKDRVLLELVPHLVLDGALDTASPYGAA